MDNETISNATVISVLDLIDKAHMHVYKHHHKTKPTLAPILDDEVLESEPVEDKERNLTRTMDLRPDKPVVLYIWREQTAHKARVMQVLPSLNALKHNEVCEITKGNKHDIFKLKEKQGMSSLHFTKKMKHKSIQHLELTCKPILGEGSLIAGSNLKLVPFTINLQIHIL